MKAPIVRHLPKGLPVTARATFTREMLRNLWVVFEAAADNDALMIEIGEQGVWAVTPDGHRMFIGHMAAPRPLDA